MENKVRNYNDVIEEFYDVFDTAGAAIVFDLTKSEFFECVAEKIHNLFAGTHHEITDDEYFYCSPEAFAKTVYPNLKAYTPVYIKPMVEQMVESILHLVYNGRTTHQESIRVLVSYLYMARLNKCIEPKHLNEDVNLFVKTLGNTSIYEGDYKKIASTTFDGKTLKITEIDFPESRDAIVSYSKNGVLGAYFAYKARAFWNIELPADLM